MPGRALDRIRQAFREGSFDLTAHAFEEMAEDGLDLVDLELAISRGRVIRIEKDDPRGARYTIHGTAVDAVTHVGSVGRFTGSGRFLVITVFAVTEII